MAPGSNASFSRKAAVSAFLRRSGKNPAQDERYAAPVVSSTASSTKPTQCCRPGKYSGKQAIAAALFRLRDSQASARAHAMETLVKLMPKKTHSHTRTIGYVDSRLIDEAASVRVKAIETLAGLVEKGDHKATNSILFRIRDEDAEVRAAAVKALAQISKFGSHAVIDALTQLVEDPSTLVRVEIARTLGVVSERGDQTAVDAAVFLAQDKDPGVRVASMEALASVLESSDRWGVQAIVAGTDDPDRSVRRAAVLAMKDAAEKGQDPPIIAIAARLEDGDSSVRAAALESLVALIDENTRDRAIAEALSRCKCSGGHIREAAVRILGLVAERGDQKVAEAAASLLADQDDRVCAAAIEACGRVLESKAKGNHSTVVTILKEINHPKAFVRRAAVDAIAEITEPRDTKGRDALLQGCIDASPVVRKAAIVALMGRCNEGDTEAIATALNHLIETEDQGVRKAAAALLGKVARSSDKQSMDAVIGFLGDADEDMRACGLKAVERFCTGNLPRGMLSRIIALLEHHRAATRNDVSEFLSNVLASREDLKNDVLELCKLLDAKVNFNTRKIVADTLKKAATKGSVNTIDAVTGLLNDAKEQVRRMAVEILCAAAQAGSEAAHTAITEAAAAEGASDLVKSAAEEILQKAGEAGKDPAMGLFSPT
eukprot:gnl/MRDRNA2_/MRDRNA2_35088_c0_seq1.p1 gnl/MRDRNA2_/MRDRNA2_35088_c0~~gnl/MRDRNA2_/MRDRNA2_35088_c0_seq1.p1  ORF type:complete len:660 (+),score=158.69 gnl/MRDRNA2_/MRDRNA2_35088_c0_seq1:44-2023(+)